MDPIHISSIVLGPDSGVTTINAKPPEPVFRMLAPDGRELLYIDPSTGTVTGSLEDAGQAAVVFMAALRTIAGGFRTPGTDLVTVLETHDWRQGNPDLAEYTHPVRHADHTFDGWCAVCKGDLPRMVAVLVAAHPNQHKT